MTCGAFTTTANLVTVAPTFQPHGPPSMRVLRPFLLALAVAAALPAIAGEPAKSGPQDVAIASSQGFLSAHPDLRYRLEGLDAYREGDYDKALMLFRRAARFADKPAQGMVAEMMWQGQGTEADRARAYAWMDLAAERNYPTMVLNRERYWKTMTGEERAAALELGKEIYAEYGDAVAKPRLEGAMRRGKNRSTGSRTGSGAGSLVIQIPGPGGMTTIDGSQYYAERFWSPEQYWAWQDTDWRALPRGRVDIGPLESVPEEGEASSEEPADPAG
jgi:hypothetical protein